MEKHRIQPVAFFAHEIFLHLDSCCPECLCSFPCHLRIRIARADYHTADSLFQNRFRTWRRLAIMTAGLQRHV